jgi:hypothetical protein
MKKGLLLSVVASTMIFAGGDIAPVEPAAPASADFWGQIGVFYDANDVNHGGYSFGDKENNSFSASVVLGVEKEIGAGFGFGAELAGWTDFGFDIADGARVSSSIAQYIGSSNQTDAEVSQAYLTYTFGNTAIKAGRQALPAAVSPWAWSDRSAGVLDIAYDALVIANTDIQDTTLVGAWVANAVNGNSPTHLGDDNNGIFMLAMVNKSLSNTTISLSGYYAPKFNLTGVGQIANIANYFGATKAQIKNIIDNNLIGTTVDDVWSIWGSVESNIDNWNVGLQAVYVDGNTHLTVLNQDEGALDATFGLAARAGSTWGDFDATFTAAYINDGEYSLKTAGTGLGTSAFWGDSLAAFGGDTYFDDQYIFRVDAGYKLGIGRLYAGLAYDEVGNDGLFDNVWGGRIGYTFTVAGVNAKVEYRYVDFQANKDLKDAGIVDDKAVQRIRVDAYYKF